MEEIQIKRRNRMAEGDNGLFGWEIEAKKGRLMLDSSNSPNGMVSKSLLVVMCEWVEDQCVFSVPLPEDDIANDLLYMANDTIQLYEREKKKSIPIVSPLSQNRLLLNNRIITPDTPCVLYSNGNKVADCIFVSAMAKEKENTEKKKEPEVIAVWMNEY